MVMTKKYDAIIIGGGHNGLVCAAYLAKSGRQVILLEANSKAGGMAVTDELDGVKISTVAQTLHALHPKVVTDLGLHVDLAEENIPLIALSVDGKHLKIEDDNVFGLNGAEISTEDAKGFKLVRRDLKRFAKFLSPMMEQKPPRLKERDNEDTWSLIKLGVKMRLLGKRSMQEFLRMALLNIADLLEDNIDNKHLAGAIAMDACWGSLLAPRSPGSVLTAMYQATGNMNGKRGSISIPKGGMGAVTEQLVAICKKQGVEIKQNARVSKVTVEDDKVTGVQLEDGEFISSSIVASSADPRQTFLKMVGAENLDINFTRRINNVRDKGTASKINLVLNELPDFTGLSKGDLKSRLMVCPDILYAEHAFNHSKYGEMAENPVMEITIPSIMDDSITANGKHVISIVSQYASFDLKEGWDDQARDKLLETVLGTLEKYAPNLRECISAKEVLSPVDLAERFNSSGGHWHHLEMQLDQMLMMRPIHGAAQYNTPIAGLFLCGAGAHPGGNVTGMPGMNAAKRILNGNTK